MFDLVNKLIKQIFTILWNPKVEHCANYSPLRTPVLSQNVFRDAAQGDILQRTVGSSSERENPAAIPT